MVIERVFLGWDAPCLHKAAEYLRQRYASGGVWDLSGVRIVTPARRAARRLLEILAHESWGETPGSGGAALIPPQIITIGDLPEQLYKPRQTVANDLQSLLARVRSLQQAPSEVLAQIVPNPPSKDDLQGWIALAQDIARLHADLAAEAVTFGEVAPLCEAKMDFIDRPRWEALAQLQEGYEAVLTRVGLQDRHVARREAIDQRGCVMEREVVLLATADLNRVTREMLEQVATTPGAGGGDHRLEIGATFGGDARITALIHAPADQADQFDGLGCFIVAQWLGRTIDLNLSQVHIVDRPRDQAMQALRVIAQAAHNSDQRPDQITIGLGDETLAPMIERVLDLGGIPARPATGRQLLLTRPAQLLHAVARYLTSRRFDDLAALLRHPDLASGQVARWPSSGWLTAADHYRTDHVAAVVSMGQASSGNDTVVENICRTIDELVPADHDQPKALPAWSKPIAQILGAIYGPGLLDRNKPEDLQLIRALEYITEVLRDQAALDAEGGGPNGLAPRVTLAQAIALTLARLADVAIAPEGGPPAVELLGWLELQLDDAPLLIVTGFNERNIPQSVTSDAFLPDHVRAVLGLLDDQRRFARDTYVLSAILASRPTVRVIAGRRGTEGDPLMPSRLLLARPEAELPVAVLAFTSPAPASAPNPVLLAPTPGVISRFYIPPPDPWPDGKPIDRLRVTAFRDYLICPYRFYLKHIMGLELLDDRATELDGMAFGTLAHRVLQDFGQSNLTTSTDAAPIADFLAAQLEDAVTRQYGRRPFASIIIQREQLRRRLDAFAQWQAEQARNGWRIVPGKVERELEAKLIVDDRPFTITGRIDRIDEHPTEGFRILDYKTGDTPRPPEQQHRRSVQGERAWIDLQLPLYQTLAATVGVTGPKVALGYLLLPKRLEDVKFAQAPWDAAELGSAMLMAREVVRNIRAGIFWPPSEPLFDEFGGIRMDASLDRSSALAMGSRQARGKGGAP